MPDHLARTDGDVLTHLEGIKIGHLDRQLAFAPFQIFQHVGEAAHQVLALALHRLAQNFGVGRNEIGRRHGVGELLRIKIHLAGGGLVQAIHLMHRVLYPARGQQIGLLNEIKDLIVFPLLAAKSFVTLAGRYQRFRPFAQHALRRVLP